MTCYFRHLQKIFRKAGLDVTTENKRDVDKVIHGIVNIDYKNCSTTWKEVKKKIAEDEDNFVSSLKEAWSKRK